MSSLEDGVYPADYKRPDLVDKLLGGVAAIAVVGGLITAFTVGANDIVQKLNSDKPVNLTHVKNTLYQLTDTRGFYDTKKEINIFENATDSASFASNDRIATFIDQSKTTLQLYEPELFGSRKKLDKIEVALNP